MKHGKPLCFALKQLCPCNDETQIVLHNIETLRVKYVDVTLCLEHLRPLKPMCFDVTVCTRTKTFHFNVCQQILQPIHEEEIFIEPIENSTHFVNQKNMKAFYFLSSVVAHILGREI